MSDSLSEIDIVLKGGFHYVRESRVGASYGLHPKRHIQSIIVPIQSE